jgi:hypothetical protein
VCPSGLVVYLFHLPFFKFVTTDVNLFLDFFVFCIVGDLPVLPAHGIALLVIINIQPEEDLWNSWVCGNGEITILLIRIELDTRRGNSQCKQHWF